MLDTIIRGGDVVDGTGAPRRRADIGIAGDRIEVIGSIDADAATVIDATGRVVTPGFVDVHTHLDAQGFWDPTLSPSPLHGVTSVFGGNCGFTIAPLTGAPDDGPYLMRMLARVEGMPLEALEQGVPWDWTDFGDYLDKLEGRLAINAGFMVGHSALRRIVMGPDAVAREATADELDAMKALLDESLAAGGLGFSSSWARTHNDADGHMVPSRYASRDELIELAAVCGRHEGTSLEIIPMNGPHEPWAVDLMADMSLAAQRPLNWNVLSVNVGNQDQVAHQLASSSAAAERGAKVVALTVPLTLAVRMNLRSGFVLDALPDWEGVMLAPLDEKMRALADPEERRRLDERAQSPGPMRGVADWAGKTIFAVAHPDNEQYVGRTVGEIAAEEGKDPFDALLDIALADELLTSFGTVARPDPDDVWKARVEVWRDDRTIIGASDAGAHLDLFLSSNYTTCVLGEAVRARGLMDLEEAVHHLTAAPADLYGLRDRGRLAEGAFADVVVLDESTIGNTPIETRFDLPAGAGRLYSEATGIDHVLCNGQVIVSHGAFTDARPGTIVRSGRDTATAPLD